MGDDENLDLDADDLDLGDDGGDDFGGDLDGMMGDDDIGGDSGGDDASDGELDSFFEDLSSIEEMDVGEDQPAAPQPQAAPQAAPAQQAQAAPQAQAMAPQQKKGKKLWVFMILLLLFGGGGGGAYWYLTQDEGEVVQMEKPKLDSIFKKEAIQVEKPKMMRQPVVTPRIEVEEIEPEPPVVKTPPPRPSARYLIQVATCSFERCVDDFSSDLRQMGQPVHHEGSGEKYDFIELISKQVFSYREANSLVKTINRENREAGKASIVFQSNGHRVTLGTFTSLDRAKKVKFHIEKLELPQLVTLNLEHVRKNYETTKVFAGPYNSKGQARQVLSKFRSNPEFTSAFLVRY